MEKEKVLQHFSEWKKAQEGLNGIKLGWAEILSWLSGYMAGFSVGRTDLDPVKYQGTFREVLEYVAKQHEEETKQPVNIEEPVETPYFGKGDEGEKI